MNPVEFPQQTLVLARDQPQYQPLPVHVDLPRGACIACFELDDEERQAIAAGGNVWLWQYTFGHPFQPVSLTTENPWSAPSNTRKPSYGALLIIVQSVCAALTRAGMQDCDDPGEAIDVIRERLEARLAGVPQDAVGRVIAFIFRYFGPAATAGDLPDDVVSDVRAIETWLGAPAPETQG